MKNKNTELSVGQTVWCKSLSGTYRNGVPLNETKISKIGKKYLEVESLYNTRFFIDTLHHDGGEYTPRYRIYLNKEQYDDEVESNRIYSELRNRFSGYGKTDISLSKLKAIHSILNSDQ